MKRRKILKATVGLGAAGALLPGTASAANSRTPTAIQPGPDGVYNIVFLGDSYMAGSDSTDGHGARKMVMDALIMQGERRDVRCVGSRPSTGTGGGYGYTTPLVHEGRPGWTTAQLHTLVAGGGLVYPQGSPHVVMLMAGLNDLGAGATASATVDGLAGLVDAILAVDANLVVVLCELVCPSAYKSTALTARTRQVQAVNASLPALVAARADRVVLARTSLLDQQDINAVGVHPTDGGYQRMGYILYHSLRPWLGSGGYMVPIRNPWSPGPDPLKLMG